jgi:hypothetical protein
MRITLIAFLFLLTLSACSGGSSAPEPATETGTKTLPGSTVVE